MGMRKFSLLVWSFAFCGSLAWAQVNTATISGAMRGRFSSA